MKRALLWIALVSCGCNTFDTPSDDSLVGPPVGNPVFPPNVLPGTGFAPMPPGLVPAGRGGFPLPAGSPAALPAAGRAGGGWQPVDAGPPVVIDDAGVDDAGH
ncbi:MAG TPA: hypothetical protein VJR89_01525 [Polyangiales bacterium]|nr:hypothetical protein [Polyangiales bacterium]